MRLILFIAYPMLPVSDASCGGAEQMLWTVEKEMAARGYRTHVAACNGSRVSGSLVATGSPPSAADSFESRAEEHAQCISRALGRNQYDVLHDKSGFWWPRAAEVSAPVLATLHLPRNFYDERLFASIPSNVSFNCVSESQACGFQDLPRMAGVVPNGIALERFRPSYKKDGYVLWLGRICPEKAPHLAMDAARRAGIKLVLAGRVYPLSWHQLYFEQQVRPRLERAGQDVEWVEQPTFEHKAELLRRARAVLLPTLAPETSSLVAMEAAACATPVVAFPNGALPEIVQDNVTGYLVHDVNEMAHAIADVEGLWPEDARTHAERHFSAKRMADRYEQLYVEIAGEFALSSRLAA